MAKRKNKDINELLFKNSLISEAKITKGFIATSG